jgi:hypothetical protein
MIDACESHLPKMRELAGLNSRMTGVWLMLTLSNLRKSGNLPASLTRKGGSDRMVGLLLAAAFAKTSNL